MKRLDVWPEKEKSKRWIIKSFSCVYQTRTV